MKTNLISLRVTDEELKTITDNADKMNLSKSEYLRKLALSTENNLQEKRGFVSLISRMCNTINDASIILADDHPDIAVSLNIRLWQTLRYTQFTIIMQNSIVSQSKVHLVNMTQKRMIVEVKLLIALCSHTGMSHNNFGAVGYSVPHLMCGNLSFTDMKSAFSIESNSRCVCSSCFTFC